MEVSIKQLMEEDRYWGFPATSVTGPVGIRGMIARGRMWIPANFPQTEKSKWAEAFSADNDGSFRQFEF